MLVKFAQTIDRFRQSYTPPGLICRFLTLANAHIKEARECWQHGAHVIWTPGSDDALVYETHFAENSDSRSVAYPGLVLCVKGSTPAAREVLDSLAEEVRKLLKYKVHGYPGRRSVVFEGTDVAPVNALTTVATFANILKIASTNWEPWSKEWPG